MTEIPSPKMNYGNSNRAKAAAEAPVEREKVERVVEGTVTQKKKSLGRKIADNFSGDNMQSIGSYIFFDVIIPQAKDMIFDAISTGAQRAMYGDDRRSQRTTTSGIGRPTAYNRMYQNKPEPRTITQQARTSHEFGDFVMETRGEAELVLNGLLELIDKYGFASVADLYDLCGQTSDFTDGKHGWTDLRSASVSRQRAGYVLDLPRTQPID
jgi:hypothetical protein